MRVISSMKVAGPRARPAGRRGSSIVDTTNREGGQKDNPLQLCERISQYVSSPASTADRRMQARHCVCQLAIGTGPDDERREGMKPIPPHPPTWAKVNQPVMVRSSFVHAANENQAIFKRRKSMTSSERCQILPAAECWNACPGILHPSVR
jgi:hypothetical protein